MTEPEPQIGFIHNVMIQYRKQVFELLDSENNVDFLITRDKSPDFTMPNMAVSEGLPGSLSMLGSRIINGDYDVLIIAGWSDLSEFIEGIFSLMLGKALGIPVVVWIEHWYPPHFELKREIVKPILQIVLTQCDAVVVPGTKSREMCLYLGASEEKIFEAPNSVTVEEPIVDFDIRERHNLDGDCVILYLSRLVPYKGCDILIKSLKKIRQREDISLLVGGEGPFRTECEKLANDLNLDSVEFVGFVDEKEKPAYFDQADLFVLPTLFRNGHAEAWGLVLNEAMSLGCPVISTTAVASAYDLIKDGENGYMVEEGNTDELTTAIVESLSSQDRRRQMGYRSKKIIEDSYTTKDTVSGFVEAVEFAKKE